MLHKSPRIVTFLRTVAVVWVGLWTFFHVMPFEGYYYVKYWVTWWFPLVLALLIVLKFGIITYVLDMILYPIFMGRDPNYQEARANGWHPFWDNIPAPLNPDAFVPPETWQYSCPFCNSRVEKPVDICWNCGYGSKGNQAAFDNRYDNSPDGPVST